MIVQANVAEEHRAREDQSSGVSLVLALDVKTDVTASRLENSDFTAHVAARHNSRATDEASTDVGKNTSVQVGHDHDIKLLGSGNTLHRGVIDNHVVRLESWILLGDLLERVAEETISKLHNVRLMDTSDLLAVVGEGKGKGKLGNALRFRTSDDLEGFDDTRDGLMLETRVLSLGVLTNDAKINVFVPGVVSRDVFDENDGGIDVELLSESDVEGLMAGTLDRCVKDT